MPQSADFPNLEKALERFAHNVPVNARRSLLAKRKKVSIRASWKKTGGDWKPVSVTRKNFYANSSASGRLANSLTGRVTGRTIIFEMEEYGQWVDAGRPPSQKYPPPEAIRDWVNVRKLKVRDSAGKFMSRTPANINAVAFLIGRKIRTFGIPATGFFTNIFMRAFDKLPDEIENALALEMDILIDKKNKNGNATH